MSVVANWGNDARNGGTGVKDAYRTIGALPASGTHQIYGGEYREIISRNIEGQGNVVLKAPNSIDLAFSGFNTIKNAILKDYTTNNIPVAGSSGIRLDKSVFIDSQYNGHVFRVTNLSSLRDTALLNYDINARLLFINRCTLVGVSMTLLSGTTPIQDSVVNFNNITFTDQVSITNTLFKDTCTFSYDDGINPAMVNANFATFVSNNSNYSWGFDLSGCDTEANADTFINPSLNDFRLKPTSKAVNLAIDGGNAGSYGVGYSVSATSGGWTNATGFSLNVSRYEATGVATIESPEIDLSRNSIIKMPYADLINDYPNGLVFDTSGNLGSAIYNAGSAIGLSIPLTADEVYNYEGVIEIVTNLRTLSVSENEFIVAQSGEVINEITVSAITGTIKPVSDYSGKLKVEARWRKDGEAMPVSYKPVFWGETILIDDAGLTSAEPGYDENTSREAVGRYIQLKPNVTEEYIKAI